MKILLLLLLISGNAFSLSSKIVGKNFDIIWAMEFINSNEILLTERVGNLKNYNLKTKKTLKMSGIPKVYGKGQGGLLDVTLHPNFKENKRVYLTYSKKDGEYYTTAAGYGTLNGSKLENFKEIFKGKGSSDTRYHFGSRLVFDNEKNIFMSIGDRGQRESAQKLDNHFGKILKFDSEGKALESNPFFKTKGVLPEIWSYGHRNPQGLFFDEKTNTLYEMEHGPRGGDEINTIEKGKNFGWPKASHGKEYALPLMVGEAKSIKGMVDPIKVYVPSIAPSDLVLYRGEFHKDFKNSLLSGALSLTHLNSFGLKTKKEQRYFDKKNLRIRAISVHPSGQVFFASDDGNIYKVEN